MSTPPNIAGMNGRAPGPRRRNAIMKQVAKPKRLTTFYGVGLLANGDFLIGGRKFLAADGVLGVECAPGFNVYKAPGVQQDLLITETATGRVCAMRHVTRRDRWYQSTATFLQSQLAPQPIAGTNAGRAWRFVRNLFSRLAVYSVWVDAQIHPLFDQFELKNDGTVLLPSGAALVPGDAPVSLASGQMLAINGLDATVHAENGDVVERFRRPNGQSPWQRLVHCERCRDDSLQIPAWLTDKGEIVVRQGELPSYRVPAGKPFKLYLSDGQKLFRPLAGSQLFLIDSAGFPHEFTLDDRGRLSRIRGAIDAFVYTMLGCPGGIERPRAFLEVMLGAVTLHCCGTVVVLGRSYLSDEPISIRTTTLRVERESGAHQPLFVRTSTSVVSYVYGIDSEWWLGNPRTPDRYFCSAKRFFESENLVSFGFHWIEAFIQDAPLVAPVDRVLAAVGRTAEGFASQPLLLHVGIFIAIALAMGLFAAFWATRVIWIVWALVWRICRHIRRAWELTTCV